MKENISVALSHLISRQSILILRLHLASISVPSGFPTNTLYAFLSSSKGATCTAVLILLDLFIHILLTAGTSSRAV
jgi:hypothetical protein